MGIGDVYPAEGRTFADPESGAAIRQLTDYPCHNHHVYFTNDGWWDGGRRLLFASARTGEKNLYSVDVGGDGSITQLTDYPRGTFDELHSFQRTAINPKRDEACTWIGRDMVSLNLDTGEQNKLFTVPDGFRWSIPNITADGKFVCTSLYQDLSDRIHLDLSHGYVGFRELHDAKPLSKVVRCPTDGSGPMETVFEENYWINHVNTSPTLSNILSFCHEGPWKVVDHRIWCLDMNTGEAWKVRPSQVEDDTVGHEYWMLDGEHMGYHGHTQGKAVYGMVRYDNSKKVEAEFTADSMHFHSNSLDLIVGDGKRDNPRVLLWTYSDGEFSEARTLALHRGSWHIQELHPHPRLSADSRRVVYTADPRGYGNVYVAEIPEDIATLPVAPTGD